MRVLSPHETSGGDAGRQAGGVAIAAVSGLVAFGLALWGADALSFDRDEAVTVSMARRPVAQIWRVLPHFDVVHGLYYLMQHFVAAAFGVSELALRAPSIIGTAVAAAAIATLGRKLAGPVAGLLAGAMYGVVPIAGDYAHVARQYAIVAALAVIVTLLFVRALERATVRAYTAYAVGVAVLGLLHLFALLLVAAHLLALLCGRPTRGRVAATVAACAAAVAALVPLMTTAWTQQSLIDWAQRPGGGDISKLLVDFTGGRLAAPLLIALMIAAWTPRKTAGNVVSARTLATAWFLVPPALLIAVSQAHPVYSPRYVLLSLPGAVLLAAIGAVRLPWRSVGVGAIVVAVALMIPPDIQDRRPSFAIDQFREAAQIVKAGERPGDAVLYLPGGRRSVADAYPGDFAGLDDIALATSATQDAALTAAEVNAATLRRRIRAVAPRRAWLVAFSRYVLCGRTHDLSPMSQAKMTMLGRSFKRQGCWQVHGLTVELYRRRESRALNSR